MFHLLQFRGCFGTCSEGEKKKSHIELNKNPQEASQFGSPILGTQNTSITMNVDPNSAFCFAFE